ncbi:serine hydrolase [Lactobacillus sp. LC28-10]|uniref:Serine hydrolase n=1 Tax=Secundilactobacillus angelensis TaxID=2722706 RepID=A0ABX1L0V5_9LACO|nr:serine hydrolase [Secundilactobacillus angelensis]MCH5462766.1 class A beta-lactamase-related serine hydrolase [Secundilactobacillus angelensis]NLR19080.1 serine hydrolase [Secundilactobacillus angelensis]
MNGQSRMDRHHHSAMTYLPACVFIISLITIFLAVGLLGSPAHADPPQSQVTSQQKAVKQKLQKYVNSVTKDGTVSISFYNLGAKLTTPAGVSDAADFYRAGQLAVSSPNAHKAYTSASTYKMFIVANILARIDAGTLNKTMLRSAGFQEMIVRSQNKFAENYLDSYGLTTMDAFVKKQGWYSHPFVAYQPAKTTAATLVSVMRKLDQGRYPFDNAANRSQVLSLMSRQVYRAGIPTGAVQAIPGSTTANKVGWIGSYNNDAGIVTLPNGQRYAIAIMTHGHGQTGFSGFPKIAQITKNIQTIVYGTATTNQVLQMYR